MAKFTVTLDTGVPIHCDAIEVLMGLDHHNKYVDPDLIRLTITEYNELCRKKGPGGILTVKALRTVARDVYNLCNKGMFIEAEVLTHLAHCKHVYDKEIKGE